MRAFLRSSRHRILYVSLVAVAQILGSRPSVASAQDLVEPVVAKRSMRIVKGKETVSEIRPGDMLTVTKEEADRLHITTHDGRNGIVSKANVATLAESVPIYTKLINANPEDGSLYTLRAGAWWAAGQQDEAMADFNRAIKNGYTKPHAYASRAIFHLNKGQIDEAIKDYTIAIKLDPQDESLFINRAAAYMSQQSFEAAVKDYSEAIGINPKQARTYQQRAIAWKAFGFPDKAREDFDKAIELSPKFVAALYGRGLLWFQLDDPDKAIDDFSAVLELRPNDADALNNRGFNYRLSGDFEQALADFEKAIELAPRFALAHQNRSWVLSSAVEDAIRDGEQAIKSAQLACQLNSYKDVSDLKALAAAFAEDGQYDKAVGWQEKVIELVEGEEQEYEETILKRYREDKPYRLRDELERESPAPVDSDKSAKSTATK